MGEKSGINLKNLVNNAVFRIFCLMILVAIVGSILVPGDYLTISNINSITKQLSEFGILALAVFVCMVSGGIDLSVVYIANLCAILVGTFLSTTIESTTMDISVASLIVIACLLALLVGLACGALNGVLIGRLRVPPMLATLGSGQMILGISTIITQGKAITGVPTVFTKLANINILIFPINFIVFLICALLVFVILERTTFGLRIYMIGSNSKAAVFSTIPRRLDLLKVYMFSGLLASASGIISVMRNSTAKPDYGTSYILFSILICVFGGTNPNGGQGEVGGVVIAAIVLQMVATLMNMFHNINTFYRDIIWGALLIIMLIINYVLDNRHVSKR